MATFIRDILFVFLAIIGLVELCRMVVLLFLRTKGENSIMIIVPISGHNEEAELLLRSAASRVKWMGDSRQKVVCLDCDMDNETREICAAVSRDYSFMEICSITQFESMFGHREHVAEQQ